MDILVTVIALCEFGAAGWVIYRLQMDKSLSRRNWLAFGLFNAIAAVLLLVAAFFLG